MSRKLPNYLRTHRKRAGLSQEEVAFLLGCRWGTKLSQYECYSREPSLLTAFECHIIFKVPLDELFPGIYERARKRVTPRARRLIARVEQKPSSSKSARKLALLRRSISN